MGVPVRDVELNLHVHLSIPKAARRLSSSGLLPSEREVRATSVRMLLLVTASLLPVGAAGQTLTGRVLEEGADVPVPGAMVSLVDRGGEHRAVATTDSVGRFVLAPPEAGEFVVEASRLGYESARSPLLALEVGGRVSIEIMMRAMPVGLEGLEVSVEREAELLLRNFGHTPGTLGTRWIDREAIEAMPLPVGPAEAIRWRGIPGVSVAEPLSPGTAELCVVFTRRGGCALVMLNGIEISPLAAQQMNSHDLEAIAILTPVDATTFYGTRAANGAVLLWTRSGRR